MKKKKCNLYKKEKRKIYPNKIKVKRQLCSASCNVFPTIFFLLIFQIINVFHQFHRLLHASNVVLQIFIREKRTGSGILPTNAPSSLTSDSSSFKNQSS